MKTLYFEGAGIPEAEVSRATVGNCRIRTAFHLDNGTPVYLEINGWFPNKYTRKNIPWKYCGSVAHLNWFHDENASVEYESTDEEYAKMVAKARTSNFEYSFDGILEFVNSLGASFDRIEVINSPLGGYYVHRPDEVRCKPGEPRYNYGDAFVHDPERLKKREAIRDIIYQTEYKELVEDRALPASQRRFGHTPRMGEEYPNFSLWVDGYDPNMLHLLRHFIGYNKHWEIRTDAAETPEACVAAMQEKPLGKYGC